MNFKIEKETRWKAAKMASETVYYVWADDSECLAFCQTEEEARAVVETAKTTYRERTKEIVYEENV